jgi:hypothetical protein
LGWTFLDFSPPAAFKARDFRKDVLFDPPTGCKRPEANARQRCAPSGAKVFGISLILRSRESGVAKDEIGRNCRVVIEAAR